MEAREVDSDPCAGLDAIGKPWCVLTRTGIAQAGAFVWGMAWGIWWLTTAEAKAQARAVRERSRE